MKKLANFVTKLFKVLLVLGIIFMVFMFSDLIFKYIINGKSFYHVYLGDKAFRNQNYSEAVTYYNKALKLYPKHVKARYNLANIYTSFEDFENARKQYKIVLKQDPGYLNARLSLGILLAEEFLEFDKAIEQYEKVIKTKAAFIKIPFLYDNREQIIKAKAIAFYNMGLAYRDKSMLFSQKQVTYRKLLLKAAKNYEKSIQLKPDNYNARFNYALTMHLLGNYTEAFTNYCKALLISPLDFEAHYNLAVLLRERKMYKEAFNQFQNAGSLVDYSDDIYKIAYIQTMIGEVSQLSMSEYNYKPSELYDKLTENTQQLEMDLQAKDMANKSIREELIRKIKNQSICRKYLRKY